MEENLGRGPYSLILLNIQSNGGPLRSSPTQPNNNPGPIRKLEINPLMSGNTPVNRITILKVPRIRNNKAIPQIAANKRVVVVHGIPSHEINDFGGFGGINIFVIVTGKESAAVGAPKVVEDRGDACASFGRGLSVDGGDDVEPSYDCP
jgi:hypothetical protein